MTLSILIYSTLTFALEVKDLGDGSNLPTRLELEKVSNPKSLDPLSQLKWYQKSNNWKECLSIGEKTQKDSALGVWVAQTYISCLKSSYQTKNSIKVAEAVEHFLNFKQQDLLLNSPFIGHKDLILNVFVDLAILSSKQDHTAFEALIKKGFYLVDHMVASQRASLYRAIGQFAWSQKQNDVAINNFLRSYSLEENPEVLARLKELKADKSLKLDKYTQTSLESDQEYKLWSRFKSSYDKGETIRLATRGVEFLNLHPGSHRTDKIRDGMSRFLKKVLYLRGKKYEAIKNDFETILLKAPPEYVLYWASLAYERGYQDSSYRLSSRAAEAWKDTSLAPDALLLAGRSAFYLAKRDEAQRYFETLIEKHSGHQATAEARYLLGLLLFREKSFDKVVPLYERFLTSKDSDKWELQVRYWLWRSVNKIKSDRADSVGESILNEFPLTYYGLIVRMSTKQNLQSLWTQGEPSAEKFKVWWTAHLDNRYERIKKLITLGWIDEAEYEILYLPDPQTATGYWFRSQLWEAAGLKSRALQDYSTLVHLDASYLNKNILEKAFPTLYANTVLKSENEFSVSKNLIWAIMRQESAFMPQAVSPSRAYGLMQMLAPTARETARWLRHSKFNVSRDIFKPEINIRFGAHFFSRMYGKYEKIAPLAIASYNVGPGNLDRWLSHRSDLSEWKSIGESLDDDIWIDELPWAETSFYVKAVMRNYLLYQIIYDKQNTLASPPWGESEIEEATQDKSASNN